MAVDCAVDLIATFDVDDTGGVKVHVAVGVHVHVHVHVCVCVCV